MNIFKSLFEKYKRERSDIKEHPENSPLYSKKGDQMSPDFWTNLIQRNVESELANPPLSNIQNANFPNTVDTSLKREVDLERIKSTFEEDPEYPDHPVYPFETHKNSHGNSTELLWVCVNCGYTSFFNYRNDVYCRDSIVFCEHCKTSQCLPVLFNGDDLSLEVKCVAQCRRDDGLVVFNGKTCPICGGKIAQFNGIRLKREYINYNYNNATKKVSIVDTIESVDKKTGHQ